MKRKQLSEKIKIYHYTNPKAYKSMKDGITYGEKGMIPMKRFIKYGQTQGVNFPDEAHEGVTRGTLNSEPEEWTENPEFPFLWRYLMHDICMEEKVILLNINLIPSDRAYVVERAHVERELYRESNGKGKPTIESYNEAFMKYWESRTPIFEYEGGFSVPEINIWSKIEFNRLNVEWEKDHKKVWQRIIKNGW